MQDKSQLLLDSDVSVDISKLNNETVTIPNQMEAETVTWVVYENNIHNFRLSIPNDWIKV